MESPGHEMPLLEQQQEPKVSGMEGSDEHTRLRGGPLVAKFGSAAQANGKDNDSFPQSMTSPTRQRPASASSSSAIMIPPPIRNTPHHLPLVAKFGNPSNRKSRDVFMQWLTPWVEEYSSTRRHSEKELLVDKLIAKWVNMAGTFCLYHRPTKQEPQDDASATTTNKYYYKPLWVTHAAHRETIGFYTKQKLSKMASKKVPTKQQRKPRVDLLVAMLSQEPPTVESVAEGV